MSIEMQYLIDATMGNILSLYRLKKSTMKRFNGE